jgi:HAE1 family hydrophobic/amphiphilic exporter-1
MLSRFFIDRPIFASVVSVLITLMGAVAYFQLPVAQYPELAPPIIRVEALYPGANAQTIADTVAAPLEQEINGVERMIYMNSTSSDGRFGLDISFEPGTNVDIASVLVQNRVAIAEPRLPEEVRRLGVTTRKQSTALVGVISLSSDGQVDDVTLANFLNTYWRDEFARIYGVGGINVMPAKEYGMRIWLDPERLKARELTVTDVNQAIREQNVQVAAGAVGRPPAPDGTNLELIVTTQGRLSDPEQFADIIVKATPDGRVVRVRDVATVELGARDYSTLATFNGRPNAVLIVYQLPGANLVDVAHRLREKLDELTRPDAPVRLPPGTQAKFFYDSSMFITESLREVQKTLFEAFVLVFLVVLVFLQSFRTTLIPMFTIPVSLVGTFLLMALFGFSINMLTMFGLILAIGIVVDDAIVVVENVERNLALGAASAKEATRRAMGEITGPIIAITLVLMAVFLPTASLAGITGEMYRQFALTIAASTFFSAVNALTLSPALCALFLRPHDPHHKPGGFRRVITWPARAFNAVFERLTGGYAWVATWTSRAAVLTMIVLGAVLFFGVYGYTTVPTGFVPNEDLGFVVVAAQLPEGASLERTKAVIDRISREVGQVDGVQDVVTLSGFSVLQGQGTSYGNAWVVLEPWEKRYGERRSHGKPMRDIDSIMNDIRARVDAIQEAQLLVFSLPAITGLGNTSGFDMRVQIKDPNSLDRQALQRAVDELMMNAMGQPGILAAWHTYRAGVPQLYLDIDRERVLKMGIPLASVFETLQTHLGSTYVNDFNRDGRTFQVNTQADAKYRLRPDDILRLEVRNRDWQMAPLGAVVKIEDRLGPDRIERYNLYTSAVVNGIPKPGTSSGDALKIMEGVARDTLPPGADFAWSTMSYQEKLAAGQGPLVFALGLLVVYLILAAQYESWSTPLAVVISVPLVVIGAVVALHLRGMDNNIFTQIGLVLLIGLGAKNAILIVEFARENRARGMSIVASAVEAARTRFRPILMTSLAFILGVLPLILATGAGAAGRQALGTAVFGGMIGVTILGLLFTPAVYVAVQTVAEWIRPMKPAAAPATVPAVGV